MMTTPQAPPKGGSAQQTQAQLAPFRSGTQRTLSSDGYTVTCQPGSSTTDLADYTPSPNNQLSGIWIYATATASGNSATVAFAGDGPLNFFSAVTFQDANEKPIIGPFDSY